jgi:4-oxalomesaconate hydratase
MASQSYLHQYQTDIAKYRANHARRISGRTDIQYAEAFQRVTPQVMAPL